MSTRYSVCLDYDIVHKIVNFVFFSKIYQYIEFTPISAYMLECVRVISASIVYINLGNHYQRKMVSYCSLPKSLFVPPDHCPSRTFFSVQLLVTESPRASNFFLPLMAQNLVQQRSSLASTKKNVFRFFLYIYASGTLF